jgi:nucleoside-diphosphate-sugar epimerase
LESMGTLMISTAKKPPKRVLVTGSEGYIGSVMMPVLLEAGYDATGLDAGWFAEGRLLPFQGIWATTRRDVRDVEVDDLRGYDAVIHLAALCNDPLGELDPELTSDINYRATVRLADVARRAGVGRFVFSSSCSMYGVADGVAALDETAPFNPQTAYARSKVEAEHELMALAEAEEFCVVILRNATAYGISPRQRFDLVVPNLAGHAHINGEVRLTSDGTPWRPLVHIRDIAAAALAVLAASTEVVLGQAYNIGRNVDNYRIREIAERVQAAYPDSHLTFGPPSSDNRSYRVDFTKVQTGLPGFSPQWDLVRGIRECRSAFVEIGLDAATFEDRRYTRLKQIRHLLEQGLIDKNLRWREG